MTKRRGEIERLREALKFLDLAIEETPSTEARSIQERLRRRVAELEALDFRVAAALAHHQAGE